ncbi:hypothetical protein [Glutamicibacter protophormiae]
MNRIAVVVTLSCLTLGLASCTSAGTSGVPEAPTLNSPSASSCDRPYVVSDGEKRAAAEFIRVDSFYDQGLSRTLLDLKATSALEWDPDPSWDNTEEVIDAVNEVSPDTVVAQPFPYVEGLESMMETSEQSPGFLGYYAATPLTYSFSVECQNDQGNWYKLSFSTWTDSDLGLIDCNLKLDSKAPDVARNAYGKYCEKS